MKLFRKEVLEQKVRTLLNSVNFSRKLKFKVTFTVSSVSSADDQFVSRWEAGPPLADLQPVLLEFHEKKDKVDVYNCLRDGLEQTGCVVTEDSR